MTWPFSGTVLTSTVSPILAPTVLINSEGTVTAAEFPALIIFCPIGHLSILSHEFFFVAHDHHPRSSQDTGQERIAAAAAEFEFILRHHCVVDLLLPTGFFLTHDHRKLRKDDVTHHQEINFVRLALPAAEEFSGKHDEFDFS